MLRHKDFFRGLAFLLCLSMILGFAPAGLLGDTLNVNAAGTTPTSIVPNGDFESDPVRPLKWNCGSGDMGFAMITTGVPGNDTQVLSMKNIGNSYLEVDSDFFSVVPGGEYRFSVKALLDDTVEPTSGWDYHILAWVMWEDPVLILDGYNIKVKPTNEWGEFTMDVTIPDNISEAAIRLYISSGKNMAAYVDDVTLVKIGGAEAPETQPTEAPTEAPTEPPMVDPDEPYGPYPVNGGFEDDLENWSGAVDFGTISTDDVYAGEKSLKYADTSENSAPYIWQKVPVQKGKTYVLTAMAKRVDGKSSGYMGIYGISNAVATSIATDGNWTYYRTEVTIVDDVTEATIEIGAHKASVVTYLIDEVFFCEKGREPAPPATEPPTAPPIPEYTEPTVPEGYEAPVIENFPSEHPYLYFSADEMAELKQLVTNSEKNIYGFSWKGQKDNLLAVAQYYLVETELRQSSNYGTSVKFQLYPHLIDPNDPQYREMYIEASKDGNGNLVENPYLGFGCLMPDSLRDRMETLSLAYALTGDTRYSDLAIRYAFEMSQWEWWGDWNWLYIYTGGSYAADACVAWATQAVAAVYDMCYDQMTEQQREIIETAIIEKGLKPMSQQVDPNSTQNANMMFVGGLLTGCAVIINEDNYEEIKPYVDLALYCVENAFDNYAQSGNTEGHYYTSFGLEYFLPGVSHMYRATELEFLFDHALMSEMLPYWTVQFAAPGTMTHPNYSDAGVSVYMKLPMAIISKNVGNGLAGYFMTKTGGLASPWQNFVYLDPTPVVEEPTDLVAVVDPIGYGGLRTGFASDDMLLTLLANNSQMGHNHYDQNSIMLTEGGRWLMTDPGVGSYYYADRSFWTHNGHTTILVDNKSQSIRGTGAMEKIFGSRLYGYIIGSAPKAYGYNTLEKFDRHAIQLNHDEKAYYIIIDDLLSEKERTYGWQMYNGDRAEFEVDGQKVSSMSTAQGNNVSMVLGANTLNLSFVTKDKLSIKDHVHTANGVNVGSTLVASSASAKAYQFMTLISTEKTGDKQSVTVTETYDDEKVLGALINYSGDLCDLVMFNRTDALVAAGKLSTDGQQASVLALLDNVITEGFAATKATTLVYDEIVLFSSAKALNIVADADGWHIDTAEAQEITLNIEDGDYAVFVNGKMVEAVIENGMATFALGAGASDVVLGEPVVEDPTDPSEPADPTDPSEPVDPTDPADPTDPSEPEGGDDNTQTGDSTPITAMIALTVLVATGMALIVTKRKFF